MSMANMKRSETTEQMGLFRWANNHVHVLPELRWMYHVPNEGKRTNGNILKAAGLKSGVPDICLPIPRNGFHGLYIEMKYGKNKATKEQKEYLAALDEYGYKTAICYGAQEAMENAYPGYKFIDAEIKYNGVNAAFYIYARMVRN